MSRVPHEDLTGQTYGRWTVLGPAPKRGDKLYWRSRCECGTERDVMTGGLRGGNSRSCGCMRGSKPAPAPEGFKVCPGCKEEKPLTTEFFHKSKTSKLGYVPRCKTCVLKKRKAYYYANTDAEKARHGEWVRNNKERARAHSKKSRAKKPEYYKEYHKRYQRENIAIKLAHNRARKARLKQADREPYNGADLHSMWTDQEGLCFYCDAPLFGTYHVEHKMPLSKGGADKLTNICLSCPTCNLRKGIRTADEFKTLLANSKNVATVNVVVVPGV